MTTPEFGTFSTPATVLFCTVYVCIWCFTPTPYSPVSVCWKLFGLACEHTVSRLTSHPTFPLPLGVGLARSSQSSLTPLGRSEIVSETGCDQRGENPNSMSSKLHCFWHYPCKFGFVRHKSGAGRHQEFKKIYQQNLIIEKCLSKSINLKSQNKNKISPC